MYFYRIQVQSKNFYIQPQNVKDYEKPPYTIWEEDSENESYKELVYSPETGVVKEIIIPEPPTPPQPTPISIKKGAN